MPSASMDRRDFLRVALRSLPLAAGLWPWRAESGEPQNAEPAVQFVFAQLQYRGGEWDPHPLAATPLMEELMQRTSVDPGLTRRVVAVTDRDLFSYPFLYMAGKYEFDPFSRDEVDRLRRFLSYGGFLLADNALGQTGYGFDKSLRRELKRVLPENDLGRMPSSHAALRSYYLIRRIGGTRLVQPYLEGIQLQSFMPVIYCHNDLGGAWERDQLGNWLNPCTPGGQEQRRDTFHLGINLILYSMTENYKEDLIHVPFIRRRLSR